MTTRLSLSALVAGALALVVAAPVVVAAPSDSARGERGAPGPRRSLDTDLPTDRPILAKVIEIDEATGTVTLATPHGPVELTVKPEIAGRLSVGDIVVVQFTDVEDESPSASPREEPASPAPRARETI